MTNFGFRTLETAHQEIDRLRKQVEALKAMKSGNTQNEITSFRLKKEQQRSAEMERKLQEQTVTLKSVRKQLRKQQEREQIVSNPVVEPISIRIAREVEEMSKVDHSKLFDILFDFMSSHRGMWNEQYINALIHELLFNVLMESFAAIQRFAESVSLALCKELGINKAILNESFYSEWIDGSKCHIFLHSAAAVGVVKSAVTDGVFMEQFMTKHLGLSSHQIPQEIHLEFASFLTKCIDISWKMSVQSPALQFTPNAFRPDAAKKMNFYDELHCVRHGDEASKHILYFLWPIVTANGFHSVMDGMKIAVCLGDTMPTKSGKDDEGVDDEEMSVEREESMGMVIFNHDPDEYQGSPSDVYQQHLHEISDESPFVAIY